MIDWWGPIILEYYGATEALGFTTCDSHEWLAHKGTVGKVVFGDLHILDDDMNELPTGDPGTIWFETATPFEYHNDAEKTKEATSPDGAMTTVNDVGYVDEDGYLYLTDRKTFMIISGGVNIYPQETENLLITHPKVADAAVFGVPNDDLGEEVKAVVQVMPGVDADDELTASCSSSAANTFAPEGAALRSTTWTSCRACRPASSTSACCATSTGPTPAGQDRLTAGASATVDAMDEPSVGPANSTTVSASRTASSVPVWASVVIAVVVLVVSAVALSPKKPTPVK